MLAADYGMLLGKLTLVIRHSCPSTIDDASRQLKHTTVVVPESDGFMGTANTGLIDL